MAAVDISDLLEPKREPYPVDRLPALPGTCPEALRHLPGWLDWRWGPDRWSKTGAPEKPGKLPFYAKPGPDGEAMLRGKNGSPEDRAALVTFEKALAAANESGATPGVSYTGVGLAMFKDWGVVAGDFDNCIDANGDVLPEVLALVAGTYAERSPSGKGIRAFWTGYLPPLGQGKDKGRWPFGFEVFTDNKWVTFTGDKLPGSPDTLRALPPEVIALANDRREGQRQRPAPAPAEGGHVWKPKTVAVRLKPLVRAMERWHLAPQVIEAAIRAEVPDDCLDAARALVPEKDDFPAHSVEENRNVTMAQWGGAMRGIGWSAEAILAALLEANAVHCSTPLNEAEVEKIARSVGSYPQGAIGDPIPFGGGHFTVDRSGVRYHGDEGKETWVCSELRKLAVASDDNDEDYGLLLEWRSSKGKHHRQSIPREMLLGECLEARRILVRGGLDIAPGKKAPTLLAAYLTVGHPRAHALSVNRLGWYDGRFVLPEETIGDAEAEVIFQSNGPVSPALSVSGEVAGWKESVARLAVGNSRLLFAISAALAGPLLEVAGEPGGGFHFRGGSSIGKTTALVAAASVWGKPRDFIRSWHATANGLEAVAALHNDGVMILDEIGEADPKTIGKTAYALSNGKGKARMSAGITARKALEWRLIYLSSGEESFRALAEREGGKVHAGQDIRLADIPADAGAGLGLFESLHGRPSPGDLAKALGNPAHYGAVGQAWLRHVVAERARLTPALRKGMGEIVALWTSPEANGQVQRVARRFALVAMAGELATEAGLTGWPAGTATWGAGQCFEAWREGFTQGSDLPHEERALLEQVRLTFEKYGTSGFEMVNPLEFSDPAEELGGATPVADEEGRVDDHQRVISRLGYRKRRGDGGFDYFALTEAFRTVICKGYTPEEAAKTLHKHGWIKKPSGKGLSAKVGWGDRPRCYAFTDKIWE